MARRNPQWQHFQSEQEILITFHGPHTYVTPTWYVENDVPTWNYVVAHAYGKAKAVDDYDGIIKILQKMTAKFESGKTAWNFSIPEDLQGANLTNAIIGFEITVTQIEGKFKLSQNRSEADRQ